MRVESTDEQNPQGREPRNPCDLCDGEGWVWECGYGGEQWKINCRCGQNPNWRDEE